MAEMPTKTEQEPTITLDKFEFGISTLTPAHKVALRRLAAAIARTMQRRQVVRGTIIVLGHTDYVGEVGDNALLGLQRAAHTIQELRSLLNNEKGVRPIDFIPKTAGETAPVSSNRTKQGRASNRRVEITLNWVVPVLPKSRPKPKPKPKPKFNIPLLTKECSEYEVLLRGFGKTRHRLRKTMIATSLYWDGTGPITLQIKDKSILNDLIKAVRDKVISKVEGPVKDKIFGKRVATKLGAITGYISNLKMIADDAENRRIMGGVGEKAREERDFVHRKLVCKLVAHDDGFGHTTKWIDYFDLWEKLDRLQSLCDKSRGTGNRGPSFGPPPKKQR